MLSRRLLPSQAQVRSTTQRLSGTVYPINHGVFEFTGMTALPPFVVYAPVRLSSQERAAELARYCEALDGLVEREPQVKIG